MRRLPRLSIFTRLILVFFCVLFIFYGLMVYLVIRNTRASRDVFLASRHAQARSYVAELGWQLDAFYAQQSNLLRQQAVRRLAYRLYSGNYEKYQHILTVMQLLQNIVSLSPLIEDVVIHLPAEEIRISALSGYARAAYPEAKPAAGQFVIQEGQPVMRLSYPLMYALSEEYIPDMVITLLFREAAIRESLAIFSDYSGSGATLVFLEELPIGSLPASVAARAIFPDGAEGKMGEQAAENTYTIDSFPLQGYPVRLVLGINNRALNQVLAQDITLATAMTVLAGAVFLVFALLMRRMIHKPLNKMVGAFQDLRQGDFDVRLYHKANDEFQYLYSAFNDTVGELNASVDKVLEQNKLINAAELAQLQSQINPHFLYNSFFIISRMAKSEDYEQIDAFVTALARYYRFINKAQQEAIPLKEEAEHMDNYISILQMRFGDTIRICAGSVPEEIAEAAVPKLILQPLIENAYEHGLKDKAAQGLISLRYEVEALHFDIVVEDNGGADADTIARVEKMLQAADAGDRSHALCNIHQRLRLYFGPPAGLMVAQSELGGFQVRLRIPRRPSRQE